MFRTVGVKERLVDRVVEEIKAAILTGRLPPETKLPPERELCEQLGVSRGVLREAVHTLVAQGLLETQHGIGTTVRRPGSTQVSEPLRLLLHSQGGGDIPFDQLHEVRSVLEVEIAAIAAAHASDEEIALLEGVLAAMEALRYDADALSEKDAEFHRTLASMTHNPVFTVLLDSIRDMLRSYIHTVTPYLDPDRDVLPPHYPIAAAIGAHDVEAARRAMREHQRQMLRNFEHMQRQREQLVQRSPTAAP